MAGELVSESHLENPLYIHSINLSHAIREGDVSELKEAEIIFDKIENYIKSGIDLKYLVTKRLVHEESFAALASAYFYYNRPDPDKNLRRIKTYFRNKHIKQIVKFRLKDKLRGLKHKK